jgi:hypothetical protein
MRNKEDGLSSRAQCLDRGQALRLEFRVTDGKNLVEQQDVRLDLCGHRESQTHLHAGRIVLQGLIDEMLQPGKVDDAREQRVDFPAREPVNRCRQPRIVPPGQFGMKSRADVDHGADAGGACNQQLAGRGSDQARDQPEQRALAGAIAADQPDSLPPPGWRATAREAP